VLEVGRRYSVAEIRDKFDAALWRVEECLKTKGRIQQIDFDLEYLQTRINVYEARRKALTQLDDSLARGAVIALADVIQDLQHDIEYLQQRKKDLLAILGR
jgi:hypothetical protein